MQLVGLVLTYNFTDCDFEKIENNYLNVIVKDLNSYVKGNCIKCVLCTDPPNCLMEIERRTFSRDYTNCTSLVKGLAEKTIATLTLECRDYPGVQRNNTQAMKKRKRREDTKKGCRENILQLKGLWDHFVRSIPKTKFH